MNTNYSEGVDVNSFTPLHQEEVESELIDVVITQMFSKPVEIEVDDYKTNQKHDEDGIYYWNDYSACDLNNYVNEQHKTITKILKEIPELYNTFTQLDLNNTTEVNLFKHSLLILSEACKDWIEIETNVKVY